MENIINQLINYILYLSNNPITIVIFLGTLTIYFIFYNIAKKIKKKFLFFIFVLPGTIMHELSHFIVGLVLNGKPTSFSLIPKKEKNGYTLGSVGFKNITFYNSIFIGLAPLLLLPLSIFFAFLSLKELEIFMNDFSNYKAFSMYFLYSYLLFTALVSTIPSGPDIKNGIFSKAGFIGLIFYISLIYLIYKLFNDFNF